MRAAAFALAALLAVAGCAPPMGAPGAPQTAAAPRQCFFASSVTSYREAGGDEAVYLRVGAKQTWRLDFLGSCPGVDWAMNRVALQQRGGGGSICRGFDVDVLVDDAGFPRRCPVGEVRRLTDAEVEALADGQRP